jgi:uncharacterized membrane protein YhiD involved in acid resistance
MATGFGLYPLAILVTLMSLLVFLIVGFIDRRSKRRLKES